MKCIVELCKKLFNKDFDKVIHSIRNNDLGTIEHFHYHKKFNFNQSNDQQDTALLVAARYNKIQIVKFIVRHFPGLIKEDKTAFGDTALMIATLNGNIQMVRFLIEEGGLNMNCRDNNGFTPFIAACANNHLKIMVYLDQMAKAKVRVKSYDKQSALHRAAYYGNNQVVRYLLEQCKFEPSQTDKWGNLPIHYAAMNCHIQTIRLLQDDVKYRDVTLQNKEGLDVLHILKAKFEKVKRMNHTNMVVEISEIERYLEKKVQPFDVENLEKKTRRT